MRLGCIVLAHRGPAQLALMLSRLSHPDVRVYFHLDRATPAEPFRRELQRADLRDVEWLPRQRSRWGGPEVVDASLAGLRRAMTDGCDYVIQISGQDFPLWPVGRVLDFFAAHPDRSYMEHFPLPDDRWRWGGRDRIEFYTYSVLGRRETYRPRGFEGGLSWKGRALNALLGVWTAFKPERRFPSYVRPYGGSQWWNLSRSALEHVLDFVEKHPDYRRYHEHTLIPDELFFQSIVAGTPFAERHELVDDALRFAVWPEDGSHPRTLRLEDLPAINASEKPFARKFDATVDSSVLEILATEVGVPR